MGFRCSKTRGFRWDVSGCLPQKTGGWWDWGCLRCPKLRTPWANPSLEGFSPQIDPFGSMDRGICRGLDQSLFFGFFPIHKLFYCLKPQFINHILRSSLLRWLVLFVARTRRLSLVHIPQTLCFSEITLPNSEWQLVCFSSISINMFAGKYGFEHCESI